jgi:hypothetical protein
MSLAKDGLAKAWAEELTGSAGFPFFPHRHDGVTCPPFGVVVVKRLLPCHPGDDVHLAEVRIVVVSDAADTPSSVQRQRTGQAFRAIESTPRHAHDVANGVRLCGFTLEEIEQAEARGDDERMIRSDVFMLRAGVASLPPQE